MLHAALALIDKHRISGAVFDTNLTLVLLVGGYDPSRLETFKRTMAFGPKEYLLLDRLCKRCGRRLTTPNVLTEVDNLSRQLPEKEHAAIAERLKALVTDMFEIYHESSLFLGEEMHKKVGLTDALLMKLLESHLVVTADFPLARRLETLGRDVINFNHLRRYAG